MIYLILTASLKNNISSCVVENRLERYEYAICETLRHVPSGVYPIIVENTYHGKEASPLEGKFTHDHSAVDIIYTDNGHLSMRNKGVNEWLDIRHVIDQYEMKDDDIIIKLTGRYRFLSSWLFEEIEQTKTKKDVWFRFMNVCTGQNDKQDCVLGCYAARVSTLSYLSWSWINLFDSPEKAIAKYIRSFVETDRIVEMSHLDVECLFSENGRVLCV